MFRFLILAIICFSVLCANAQTHLKNFYTRWGGSGIEIGNKIIELPNKTIACAGTSYSFGNGQSDGYLIVLDSLGNQIWSQCFGGSLAEQFKDFIYNPWDSSFVLAGFSSSNPQSDYNAYLVHVSSTGKILWETQLGTSDWDVATGVILNSNQELLVCGYSSNAGLGKDDAMIWKLNYSNGQMTQSLSCGGSENDYFNGLLPLSATLALAYGQSMSYGNPKGEGYIVAIQTNGDTLFHKTFQENLACQFNTACHLSNGMVLLGGSIDSLNNGLSDAWFVKTNTLTFLPFYKRSHGLKQCNESCRSLLAHNRFYSEAYALYNTCENDLYSLDPKLIYLTWGGDFWGGFGTGTFGFDLSNEEINSMCYTQNNDVLFTGYTQGLGAENPDLLVIRRDSLLTKAESIVAVKPLILDKRYERSTCIIIKSDLHASTFLNPFFSDLSCLITISGHFIAAQSPLSWNECFLNLPSGYYTAITRSGQKMKCLLLD